jgi:hypothetical protein
MNGFGVSPIEIMASEAMLSGLVYCDNFTYSAAWIAGTATALAGLATVPVNIPINSDSDFVIQEIHLTAYEDDDGTKTLNVNPDYLLTVATAGSGREIMNQAQHVLNYCGGFAGTKFPNAIRFPKLIQANNVVRLTLQNLSTLDALRVDLALIGFKVFYVTSAVTGEQGTRQNVFHAL